MISAITFIVAILGSILWMAGLPHAGSLMAGAFGAFLIVFMVSPLFSRRRL